MVSNSDNCKLELSNDVELDGLSRPTGGPTYEYRASKGEPTHHSSNVDLCGIYISSDNDTFYHIEIWVSTITNIMDWHNCIYGP